MPEVTVTCVNRTHFIVQWTELCSISQYVVTYSNGKTWTVDSGTNQIIYEVAAITNVTVMGVDNANRPGEISVIKIPSDIDIDSELYDTLRIFLHNTNWLLFVLFTCIYSI